MLNYTLASNLTSKYILFLKTQVRILFSAPEAFILHRSETCQCCVDFTAEHMETGLMSRPESADVTEWKRRLFSALLSLLLLSGLNRQMRLAGLKTNLRFEKWIRGGKDSQVAHEKQIKLLNKSNELNMLRKNCRRHDLSGRNSKKDFFSTIPIPDVHRKDENC